MEENDVIFSLAQYLLKLSRHKNDRQVKITFAVIIDQSISFTTGLHKIYRGSRLIRNYVTKSIICYKPNIICCYFNEVIRLVFNCVMGFLEVTTVLAGCYEFCTPEWISTAKREQPTQKCSKATQKLSNNFKSNYILFININVFFANLGN